MTRCAPRGYAIAYLVSSVRGAHTDNIGLGKPPQPYMFRGVHDGVHVLHNVVEGEGLLGLHEAEGRADFQLNLQDQPGAAEATQGGREEVRTILP